MWSEVRPVPDPVDVGTSFGLTRAYRWAGDGVPLVLLHGGGMTALSWAPYLPLLPGRSVVAIDILGDTGRSEQSARLTSSEDVAAWLDETLGALGVDQAVFAGHSFGGYVCMATATHRPGRVGGLVLLDPLGIAPLRLGRFLLWGVPVLAGALAPAFLRRRIGRRLRNPMLEDKRASRLVLCGMTRHVPGYPLFRALTDEKLAAITAPVHVLVADRSEPFDSTELARRADALVGCAHVTTVPDAGHALTVSHRAECARAMLDALRAADVLTQ